MCKIKACFVSACCILSSRFYKGEVSPVVTEVSQFMETILDDCSGENLHVDSDFPSNPGETTFLVLRVLTAAGWVSLYADDDDGCDDGVRLSSADVPGGGSHGKGLAGCQPPLGLLTPTLCQERRYSTVQSEGSYTGLKADGRH